MLKVAAEGFGVAVAGQGELVHVDALADPLLAPVAGLHGPKGAVGKQEKAVLVGAALGPVRPDHQLGKGRVIRPVGDEARDIEKRVAVEGILPVDELELLFAVFVGGEKEVVRLAVTVGQAFGMGMRLDIGPQGHAARLGAGIITVQRRRPFPQVLVPLDGVKDIEPVRDLQACLVQPGVLSRG